MRIGTIETRGRCKRPTKAEFIDELNEIGPPKHDHPGNGGRVTWSGVLRYGVWLHDNDPVAFEIGYREFVAKRTGQ